MSRLGRMRPNRPRLFGPVSDVQEISGTVAVTLEDATSTTSGSTFLTVIRNPVSAGVNR